MIKMRRVSYLLVFAFVPVGCSQSDAPVAPSAASVAGTDSVKVEPPKAVKKAGRIVNPGGAGTSEP